MKRKVLLASRILLSIVAFVAAGSRTEGLSLMVQQISSVGARQWLGLMVGVDRRQLTSDSAVERAHRPFADLQNRSSR
jgi:hypothetical protein